MNFFHRLKNRMQAQPRRQAGKPSETDGLSFSERRLQSLVFLSRLALFLEKLWPRLFYPSLIAFSFVILSLFNFWTYLPQTLNIFVLAIFALGFFFSLYRTVQATSFPQKVDAVRRLERKNALHHRPLSSLNDQIALHADNISARGVWERHKEYLNRQLTNAKVYFPLLTWSARDPYALRAIFIVLIFIGFVLQGSSWRQSLERPFYMAFGGTGVASNSQLEVWFNPPAYTGKAPVYRELDASQAQTRSSETLALPVSSEMLALIKSDKSVHKAFFHQGSEKVAFEQISENSLQITHAIEKNGRIRIQQGGDILGSWDITVIPDTPPQPSFLADPKETPQQSLDIAYQVDDDYGVSNAYLTVYSTLFEDAPIYDKELTLAPIAGETVRYQGQYFADLVAHPLAGSPAILHLRAFDTAGQEGHSEAMKLSLPMRKFTHPLAVEIQKLRRELYLHPDTKLTIMYRLFELHGNTQAYDGSFIVSLLLSTAAHRIGFHSTAESLEQVQEMLWKTALYLEYGDAALAQRELRRLFEELQKAIREGADPETIAQLFEQLQKAMQDYLAKLMQSSDPAQAQNPQGQGQMIQQQDLQSLMDKARSLSESGSKDAAQEMLSQLQRLLESITNAQSMQQMMEGQSGTMDSLQELEDISRTQQQILNETYQNQKGQPQSGQPQSGQPQSGQPQSGQPQSGQQGQGGQGPGEQPDGKGEGHALGANQGQPRSLEDLQKAQELLERRLDQLLQGLEQQLKGEGPNNLRGATQEMNKAARSLQRNDTNTAVQNQSRALEQMQNGINSMIESLAKQLSEQQGNQGSGEQRPGQQTDPFGRGLDNSATQGGYSTREIEVPSDRDIQRAREILHELRKRQSDPDKPAIEKDYIKRLLEQF